MMTSKQAEDLRILERHENIEALKKDLEDLISKYGTKIPMGEVVGQIGLAYAKFTGFMSCKAWEESRKEKGQQ